MADAARKINTREIAHKHERSAKGRDASCNGFPGALKDFPSGGTKRSPPTIKKQILALLLLTSDSEPRRLAAAAAALRVRTHRAFVCAAYAGGSGALQEPDVRFRGQCVS